MTNPYDILKISSNSSKAEIDAAYYRLMEEYTNEKNDSVTSDIADYKINELKTAYNQITNQLKNNSTVMGHVVSDSINPYYSASHSSTVNDSEKADNRNSQDKTNKFDNESFSDCSQASGNNENQNNYEYEDVFAAVRQFIDLEKYIEAENLLNSINYKDTATWHFLYGKLCMGRGWLNQAAVHFERASALSPDNDEYRQEAVKINKMKLDKSSKIPVLPVIAGAAFFGCVTCSRCLAPNGLVIENKDLC